MQTDACAHPTPVCSALPIRRLPDLERATPPRQPRDEPWRRPWPDLARRIDVAPARGVVAAPLPTPPSSSDGRALGGRAALGGVVPAEGRTPHVAAKHGLGAPRWPGEGPPARGGLMSPDGRTLNVAATHRLGALALEAPVRSARRRHAG